ncbi:MAG: hypothetical protein COB67_04875 [SAR324 cluster bacterium]|uniref:Uncharacterized protein n=1 Tax=SAR324 cluster bacterium TaxID=2024889 RepID=A0A2A4T7V8_9DELT|nr:MAG: hypothetical protein COB67_04875 [SAR324 cluster bacterium]
MTVKTNSCWDLTACFLKHSETLLAKSRASEEKLISALLLALSEVFLQSQLSYQLGHNFFFLQHGELQREANRRKRDENSVKIPILKLEDSEAGHFLWIPSDPLHGDKQYYVDLICNQFSCVIREFYHHKATSSFSSSFSMESPLFPLEGDVSALTSTRGTYRKQKSIILTIDHYQRQNERKETGADFFDELPGLEQELIDLHHHMLNDLEAGKAKIQELELEIQNMRCFYQRILCDFRQKMVVMIDALALFSSEDSEQLLKDVLLDKLLAHKNTLELLNELITGELSQPLQREQRINCLELFHEAIARFSESNGARQVSFDIQPGIEKIQIKGDFSLLVKMLSCLLELLLQFHEICGRENSPLFSCDVTEENNEVGLSITLQEIDLPDHWDEILHIPDSLYHSNQSKYLSFALFAFFLQQTISRHQGCLIFIPWQGHALECLMKFQGLEEAEVGR